MKRSAVRATLLLCLTIQPLPSIAGKKGPPAGNGGAYDLIVLAPTGVPMTRCLPTDLDEFGNVVGSCRDADDLWRGFYFIRSENSFLHFPPGVVINGLNNFSELVGADQNDAVGLYWSSPLDADPAPLPPLSGHAATFAAGINDAGIITGQSWGGAPGDFAAVAWSIGNTGVPSAALELELPAGYTVGVVSNVAEINDGLTYIAGLARSLDGQPDRAMLWGVAFDDGELLLAGATVVGSSAGVTGSAHSVNGSGDVVGSLDSRPFRQSAGQPLQFLPDLNKSISGAALGINDAGRIVGEQRVVPNRSQAFGVPRAVLWPDASTVVDLNTAVGLAAGETLESAVEINNQGMIVGSGYFPSANEFGNAGFLLVPR